MAKNDFLIGFLQGIYQGGVGNPEVQQKNDELRLKQEELKANIDAKMHDAGMVPDTSSMSATPALPGSPSVDSTTASSVQNHVENHPGVWSIIKGALYPGSNTSLQTAYKPDPNAAIYGQNPQGQFAMGTPSQPLSSDYAIVPKKKGVAGLATQYNATQTRDAATERQDPNNPLFKAKQMEKDWTEVRKLVNPFRTTGMGGSASVFNKAAVANQAAARGLKILNKSSLTWQELNAYVNSDIASIQRSGTPTDIQLHEANYNTLLGILGSMKTMITGKPSTGLVPKDTVDQIRQNINDIIQVDNQIIDDGISYVESAYPEAIASRKGTWEGMKNSALKIKAVGGDTGRSSPDQEAINWARSNSKDPRSKEILKLHGL